MAMDHREGEFTAEDGLALYWQAWLPQGTPRCTVVLSHGMGEHSGRYQHVAEAFCGAGLALYAYDHRGHGRSAGKRGHVPSYTVLLSGLDSMVDMVKREHSTCKTIVYGHSFGGQVAINYALRNGQKFECLIATASWLTLPFTPPAWKTGLASFLNSIVPSLALSNELDVNALSRDAAVVKAYVDDPLVHDRISVRMYNEGVIAAKFALSHAEYLQMPVLLLHGRADRITNCEGTRTFYDHVGSVDRTLKIYDGLFHEIHNEPERAIVIEDMLHWIWKHV
jgi:alpha-beta hydrolase superfamily lysophospholipase